MTEKEQQQEAEVSTKVSSMREAILAGPVRCTPAPASSSSSGSKAAAKNMAGVFARQAMNTSWIAQTDGQLLTDILPVVEGGCIYLPGFLCEPGDFGLLQALTRDLQAHAEKTGSGMITWSQHLKYEDPDWSPTFVEILRRLEEYFNVEILATRLNFYKDATMWKPYHHDSHAYGGNGKKEDFTMGASFGAMRELAFKHVGSGTVFSFPQGNGDVFAFTSEVNSKFQHGVPRAKGNPERVGPRFSIIAWGRRRALTERNSSVTARLEQQGQPSHAPSVPERGDGGGAGGVQHGFKLPSHKPKQGKEGGKPSSSSPLEAEEVVLPEMEKDDARPPPLDMSEVVMLVEKLVLQEAGKKKGNNGAAAGAKASAPSRGAGAAATGAAAAAASDNGKAKAAAGGGRRRGRVQHSWASSS